MDEVEEGEMVEDKLIIPEEFKNYLNQVADIESNANGSSPVHIPEDKSNDTAQVNANATTNVPIQNTNNTAATNSVKTDTQMLTNPTFNVHGWRNSTASLYPMSSPLTQPQSPASVISQIMPPSPQHMMSGMHIENREDLLYFIYLW